MTRILKKNENFNCPICNKLHVIDVYGSVNVQHNPELKNKVLNGEINTFPCTKGYLFGQFLYVDGDNWIWLFPNYFYSKKSSIEKEILEMEKQSKRLFGNNASKIQLVFGYDDFLKLFEELEAKSKVK